jgi:hypothetical protein
MHRGLSRSGRSAGRPLAGLTSKSVHKKSPERGPAGGLDQGVRRRPGKAPAQLAGVYAARRFTLLSAMAVSFLSTAFSSSRFC